MEVPEPRTVNCKEVPALRGDVSGEIPAEFGDGFIGDDERDCKVFPDMLEIRKMRGIDAAVLAAFGFGSLCGLGGECLVDFHVSHFQFAEQIEQQAVFLGRQIAFGFFVQRIQHVD